MKTCKVRPRDSSCRLCYDNYADFVNCVECEATRSEYELIEFGANFWGPYAIVQRNGKAEKVDLDRVYDIKET